MDTNRNPYSKNMEINTRTLVKIGYALNKDEE